MPFDFQLKQALATETTILVPAQTDYSRLLVTVRNYTFCAFDSWAQRLKNHIEKHVAEARVAIWTKLDREIEVMVVHGFPSLLE